jgi:hypothetical protein
MKKHVADGSFGDAYKRNSDPDHAISGFNKPDCRPDNPIGGSDNRIAARTQYERNLTRRFSAAGRQKADPDNQQAACDNLIAGPDEQNGDCARR